MYYITKSLRSSSVRGEIHVNFLIFADILLTKKFNRQFGALTVIIYLVGAGENFALPRHFGNNAVGRAFCLRSAVSKTSVL